MAKFVLGIKVDDALYTFSFCYYTLNACFTPWVHFFFFFPGIDFICSVQILVQQEYSMISSFMKVLAVFFSSLLFREGGDEKNDNNNKKKSWEKMSINQKRNNIKCVCGVSGLSARWKEYFLLCRPGGMTLWRSSFSCSSHHFATVYGFIAWLLILWHKMSFMQETDSHFGTFCILIYIAFIFIFFLKLSCLAF